MIQSPQPIPYIAHLMRHLNEGVTWGRLPPILIVVMGVTMSGIVLGISHVVINNGWMSHTLKCKMGFSVRANKKIICFCYVPELHQIII